MLRNNVVRILLMVLFAIFLEVWLLVVVASFWGTLLTPFELLLCGLLLTLLSCCFVHNYMQEKDREGC